jgi:hypothetical protein
MIRGFGRRAMKQFYIGDDDEDAVRLCTLSQIDGALITVAGLTAEGQVKLHTGIVQSLVRDEQRDPDRRWRVTMYEGESRTSTLQSA